MRVRLDDPQTGEGRKRRQTQLCALGRKDIVCYRPYN